MRKLERVSSPFNEVDVWENGAGRIDFEVSGATHATWHPERLTTGHAWDAITAGVLSHPGPLESILLLGLGGGTCLRQLRFLLPRARLVAMEIDAEMIRLARDYMDLDALQVEIMEGDAYELLREPGFGADVVVDDLYVARGVDVERPMHITPEHLHLHLGRLRADGSLVMNFVTGKGHRRAHARGRNTFRNLFPGARALRPPLSHNEVLVGTRHPLPLLSQARLHSRGRAFPLPEDRETWEDLRSLKLR